MFTGLIDSTGIISGVTRTPQTLSIAITPDVSPYDVKPGDSVAINGVCLTVESAVNNVIFFTAVFETLKKTTLSDIPLNSRVNLERALKPSDRMGGHFVLGHVDGTGRIVKDINIGKSTLRSIWVPAQLRVLTAPGGSIAIDGVSLTIAECYDETITVSLIPYTLQGTTLGGKRPGDKVNIECDVLARYIYHIYKRSKGRNETPDSPEQENLLIKLEKLGF